MKNITKRDLIAFALGIFTLLIVESLLDLKGTKKAFNEGYESGKK